MNLKALILATLVSNLCFGQVGLIPGANDPSKADLKVMTDNRSIVSTKIDPFKGQAEGYVVGIDEGSFDIKEFKEFVAELRGQVKLALNHHEPAENQYKMVVATSVPAKLNTVKSKKKNRRQLKSEQKI